MPWYHHLVIVPILLPLVVTAITLLLDDRWRAFKRVLTLGTTVALIAVSAFLVRIVSSSAITGAPPEPLVYLLGNWAAPFGIVLVADRLSTLMLLLTSVVGFTSLFYAMARWDRSGPRFHALFLLLLMGVNGAFLTGDIFNLFVFFEILLAASYGLVLHGAGAARTTTSLHYITINIAASMVFLVGVAMIYSVTGTLNMADLATRVAQVPASDLMLLEGGAALLGVVFLVKAGAWPLGFWLPRTYAAASPPVAAVFAILSKVGIYAILRMGALMFGKESGGAAGFADEWLIYGGLATMGFGFLGILASKQLTSIAGYYMMVSSGTLLCTIGVSGPAVTAAMLFYLVSSTLGVSALYLIIEPVERNVDHDEHADPVSEPVFDDEYLGVLTAEDESEEGVVIPGTIALLGGGFIFCALLLAGLPPLSGFIAKFAIIDALFLNPAVPLTSWLMIGLMIAAGLATLIAMTRAGIDFLWTPTEDRPPKLSVIEVAPITLLLSVCLALMLFAGPVMRYMEATVRDITDPFVYIHAVQDTPRVGAEGPQA